MSYTTKRELILHWQLCTYNLLSVSSAPETQKYNIFCLKQWTFKQPSYLRGCVVTSSSSLSWCVVAALSSAQVWNPLTVERALKSWIGFDGFERNNVSVCFLKPRSDCQHKPFFCQSRFLFKLIWGSLDVVLKCDSQLSADASTLQSYRILTQQHIKIGSGVATVQHGNTQSHMLRFSSASESFRGAFEGQLRHNAGSSRCSFFSLFLEDASLRSFVASHIPRFFVRLKKKKEREKMATSRAVDRHFRGPGWQKSWRKRKTSGDTTRKCSKG